MKKKGFTGVENNHLTGMEKTWIGPTLPAFQGQEIILIPSTCHSFVMICMHVCYVFAYDCKPTCFLTFYENICTITKVSGFTYNQITNHIKIARCCQAWGPISGRQAVAWRCSSNTFCLILAVCICGCSCFRIVEFAILFPITSVCPKIRKRKQGHSCMGCLLALSNGVENHFTKVASH